MENTEIKRERAVLAGLSAASMDESERSTEISMEELAARHTAADMAALRALQRQAEEASARSIEDFAQALFRYHRGVTFLSGNTITPLIFNAFTTVNLAFWQKYIASEGTARCLETLERFTDCIAAGEGAAAAELLRTGIQRFCAYVE